MTELLPCPFCGGEAETLTAESMHGGYLFGIMCNDCRSRGDVYDTEAEAIAAWNSRAERTCETCDQMDNPDSFIRHLLNTERTCKNTSKYKSVFNCSECKWVCCDTYSCESEFNYCPNCGARVEVGE